MSEELRLSVYGRVQGVNFRSSVKYFADKNGIKGFAINNDDGTVMIVAQGKMEKLKELLKWIKSSPGFSRIDKIKEEWGTIREECAGFEVLRNNNIFIDKAKSVINLGRRMLK